HTRFSRDWSSDVCSSDLFGDRTKKSGYWELRPGGRPTPIIWEDRSIGGVQKAENADRIIYTAQTFTEFPDYWVADTRFRSPRKEIGSASGRGRRAALAGA